jgi:F420H(2)-dependent quinone reductase
MARLPVATRLLMRLDVWAVRWTGGSFFMWLFARRAGLKKNPRLGSPKAGALVLVTRGRRTGRPRSVVLPFFTLDDKTFVVGSKGGAHDDPDWVLNLRVSPSATVYIRRHAKPANTRLATTEERAALWPKLIALAPTYEGYQRGTRREIPLVIVE